MPIICPKCREEDCKDLTQEVIDNVDFNKFFKKFIYCPDCDLFMFIGTTNKFDAESPLVVRQPPPKSGARVMARTE